MTAPIAPPSNPLANPLERVAPYAIRDAILSEADLAELLAFASVNEAHFEHAGIGGTGKPKPEYRISLTLPPRYFMPWRARIKAAVAPLLPDILRDLGMKPFDVGRYEIELVRHNDGDFYLRHIDTNIGAVEPGRGRRAVSLVYYFHAEPKAFTGGALRLYALTRKDIFTDIAPGQNRLVAFPSWVPHEVMPISCPSKRFGDSRFAINCWVHTLPPPPTTPAVEPQS